MHKRFFLILGFALLSAVSLYAVQTVFASTFPRNLSKGMNGPDVKALQVFLNSDPRTRITLSGPGSPGNETTYFGSLTALAVAKYQDLNAATILTPAGLSRGNGFVGSYTRTLIEKAVTSNSTNSMIYTTAPASNPWVSPTTSTLPIQNPREVNTLSFGDGLAKLETPILAFFSSYEVSPGDTLKITGGGFLKENTIKFDTKYGTPFSLNGYSSDGTTISLPIPKDAVLGKYTIWLTNEHGTTKYSKRLAIKNKSTPSPTITSITPSSGTYGTEVTITGSGFTPKDNEIVGALSIMEVPSDDGRTLRFTIQPIPEMFAPTTTVWAWKKGFTWKMRFGVMNSNGLSSPTQPAEFLFKTE